MRIRGELRVLQARLVFKITESTIHQVEEYQALRLMDWRGLREVRHQMSTMGSTLLNYKMMEHLSCRRELRWGCQWSQEEIHQSASELSTSMNTTCRYGLYALRVCERLVIAPFSTKIIILRSGKGEMRHWRPPLLRQIGIIIMILKYLESTSAHGKSRVSSSHHLPRLVTVDRHFSNCRDAPMLQVTANRGRLDQRPPGIMLA